MALRFVDVASQCGCFRATTPVLLPSELAGHFVDHIAQSPDQRRGLGGIAFTHRGIVALMARF
ncbi:hypothetical protein A5641_16275 [Mycobacterium sp. 1554424.7]|nr:hypothetical protein A5641_16275 [Mycobacterium sp. 1554424.7]